MRGEVVLGDSRKYLSSDNCVRLLNAALWHQGYKSEVCKACPGLSRV